MTLKGGTRRAHVFLEDLCMYTLILFDLEFDTVTRVGEQRQGKAGPPASPKIFATSYIREHGMTHRNQILPDDREENFYRVDYMYTPKPWSKIIVT